MDTPNHRFSELSIETPGPGGLVWDGSLVCSCWAFDLGRPQEMDLGGLEVDDCLSSGRQADTGPGRGLGCQQGRASDPGRLYSNVWVNVGIYFQSYGVYG